MPARSLGKPIAGAAGDSCVRHDVDERREREGALRQSRMRDAQARLVDRVRRR